MAKIKQAETFSISREYFKPEEVGKIMCDVNFIKNNHQEYYGNVACSFDIEVSSFYRKRSDPSEIRTSKPSEKESSEWEKCACMYCFVFGINGKVVIGRTWEEAIDCFKAVSNHYQLSGEKRMVFYVHNLAYEFQFIRKRFEWIKVFALDDRKPVQAVSTIGIEFKCSYQLSGYSLASVGKNLTKYHVEKLVGDLDYSKLRHSRTDMSETEIGYVVNDGLVVMAYIQERIEDDGSILKIPLTKTGYVRKYCRNHCLYNGGGTHKKNVSNYNKYHRMMESMQITSIAEYKQLKRAFQGGFTHADALHSGLTMHDVTSYDFTSSYPYCMIAFKYPMSSGKLVNISSKEDLEKYLNYYCCLFDITFDNLKSAVSFEHPISFSKCKVTGHYTLDNGRIVEAETVSTTITEEDYAVYRKFYKWDRMRIKNFRIYKKGYLPTAFVKSILDLYVKKTTLKGLEDEESKINYAKSKEQLNSCYGMTVTDPCRDDIIYDANGWSRDAVDLESSLRKYDEQKNRFLFYPWGVWVTAYARRNLFTGIWELGKDFIYADTDSIKGTNFENHMDYINAYNANVLKRLQKAMDHHHLSIDLCRPKTIKGKEKLIGVWDFDGHYKTFKTLGAKRYMVETDDGTLSLTVSGINKKKAIPYLVSQAEKDKKSIFDLFNDDLFVPAAATGKNIHTYIDYEQSGDIVDYKGKPGKFHELSSVHMEGADYSLSLSDAYIAYLEGIKEHIE